MKKNKKEPRKNGLLITITITLIYTVIAYYLAYPAIDIHNFGFYAFIVPVLIVFLISHTITNSVIKIIDLQRRKKRNEWEEQKKKRNRFGCHMRRNIDFEGVIPSSNEEIIR